MLAFEGLEGWIGSDREVWTTIERGASDRQKNLFRKGEERRLERCIRND